jgi:putative ABC transport system permease protein
MSLGDFPGIRRLLRQRRGSRGLEQEIDDEIHAHIAMRVEQLVAAGWSVEAAEAEAARRFGNAREGRQRIIAAAREGAERSRRRHVLETLQQDIRLAVRQMRRAPGFTALALATFALGIGLTAAVFAVLDGVLLQPLPFPQPERLVYLSGVDSVGSRVPVVSADDWYDWRRQSSALEPAIYLSRSMPVIVGGEGRRLPAAIVSDNFFRTLGARLERGRVFSAAEADAGALVAMVSARVWREQLGADPGLATPIRIGTRAFDVIGVVADGQEYPEGTDLWIPYRHRQMGGYVRNNINWVGIGRLAPNVSLEGARTSLSTIARRIHAADPMALYSYGVDVRPLHEAVVEEASTSLPLLLAAVAVVLVIGCVNLASVSLARTSRRRREMAVRSALGAGRGRLVRQVLVEHTVLALAGGAVALVLTHWGTRLLVSYAGAFLPRARDVGMDLRVVLFGLALAVFAGLLSGLLPALRASRTSLASVLAEGGRGNASRRGVGGHVLVGVEIALALGLATGAGLLIRSFRAALDRQLGYDTTNVVAAEVPLAGGRYRTRSDTVAFWGQLFDALRSEPGVESVAAANWLPLGLAGTTGLHIGGETRPGNVGYRVVSEDYFRTMRIPLMAGRTFGPQDDGGSTRVAVISQTAAETYWPGRNAIGEQLRSSMEQMGRGDGYGPPVTVVGIVGDIRQWGHETDSRPEMYTLYRQVPHMAGTMSVVVRGRIAEAQLVRQVASRIRALDPELAAEVEPYGARHARSVSSRRFSTTLLTLFGILALTVASVGVYAVLSYMVAGRTREIAVRTALGAARGRVVRMVLGDALMLVGIGSAAGLLAALAFTRVLESMLFGVKPTDLGAFAGATVVVIVVATAAAALPAWRAARVDPAVALRSD